MWHPFHLMTNALTLPPTVRDASAATAGKFIYRQWVTRWFKDKSSAEQWPPDLDARPGVTLTRRMDGGGRWHIEVEHTWELQARRKLTGTLVCDMRGWRRPLRYEFRQTFANRAGHSVWPETRETGRWQPDGTFVRQSFVGEKSATETLKSDAWLAVYALLVDFPAWSDAWPKTDAACFGEGGTLLQGARLQRCELPQTRHALAAGMRGYVLQLRGGMPQEFWVNENGIVIYWIEGPNRAMALADVETLA